jgi:hypothetical protein
MRGEERELTLPSAKEVSVSKEREEWILSNSSNFMGTLRGEGLVALEQRHLTTSFTAEASSLLSSHTPG